MYLLSTIYKGFNMKKTVLVLLLSAAFGLTSVATAQTEKATPTQKKQTKKAAKAVKYQDSIEAVEVVTVQSTVLSVSKKHRSITVKFEDGSKNKVVFGKNTTKFDTIKVGDVFVSQLTRVAMIDANSEAAKVMGDVKATVTSTVEGKAIDSGVGQFIAFNTTVQSINLKEHKVKFIDSEGVVRTISVKNPELQARLADLKVGQRVRIRLGYSFNVADVSTPNK